MKRKILIEFIVAVLVLLVIIFSLSLLIGIKAVFSFQPLDINIHDTYFVVGGYVVIFLLWFLLFFFVSLVRQFFIKFKNIVSNFVLIVGSSILIFWNYALINFVSVNNSTTIYPPLSSIPHRISEDENSVTSALFYLWAIEIFLFVIVVIAIVFSIKIFRKKKIEA